MKSFVACQGWCHSIQQFALGVALMAMSCGSVFAADKDEDKDDGPIDPAMQHKLDLLKSIEWQDGPGTAKLGTTAEIKIPAGYRFTGQAGAAKWAELGENVPSSSEVGVLMPKDHSGWYIVFSYEDSGHIADDEKAELDAAAILKSLREGNDEENAERRRRNWAPLQLLGWQVEPTYDAATHYLVWALRVSSEGHESINYNTRMLGRTGVMSANLVVDPDKLQSAIGPSKQLLTDYKFTNGSKYAEWKTGDKVAAYGLTGLITGGLVVAAAKTGLLAKLGLIIAKFAKVIIIGVAALGAGIAKFFRSIFGGGKAQSKM